MPRIKLLESSDSEAMTEADQQAYLIVKKDDFVEGTPAAPFLLIRHIGMT